MRARPTDPRDQTSQVDDPSYRVYFWADDAGTKEEWELSETDISEVLDWISTRANGRSHSLWAVTRSAGRVCLIRLRGIDLDARRDSWPAWADEAR